MRMVARDLSLDPKRFVPRAIANAVSAAKNELIDHEAYAGKAEGPIQTTYAECYAEYQRRLRVANALDFDDPVYSERNENRSIFRELDRLLQVFIAGEHAHADGVARTEGVIAIRQTGDAGCLGDLCGCDSLR